ncbi:hypothetical protein [Aerococcus urinaeequi]|uniref:hypothetical protein n=1 Tax=Aerococcus urinaeequi TaxID=51665 RepID=UPI003D6C5ADE
MAYKVTQAIRDLKDNQHYYRAGDVFPREGLKVDDERVAELVKGGYIVADVEEDADLSKLKKDELVALAVEKGIEVDTKDTKAEIIEKLEV